MDVEIVGEGWENMLHQLGLKIFLSLLVFQNLHRFFQAVK